MMRLSTPWVTLLVAAPFALGLNAALADDDHGGARTAFEFADPEIVESSGLAVSEGLFATVNDSGDVGRTFVVDPDTGKTVGGVTWGEATDVESLAPTPNGGLLVGDTGGNIEPRSAVELIEVPFERGQSTGGETRYTLDYPDGGHDAEALLVHPRTGEVLIATKGLFSGVLYAAPRPLDRLRPGSNGRLRARSDVIRNVTDGAFFPDGRHLILRNYTAATVYTYPGLREVDSFTLPSQPQGEAIAVSPLGKVFVSTEGQFTPVWEVTLPDALAAEVRTRPDPTPRADPTPSPPATRPGEDPEASEEEAPDRPVWPWLVGVLVGAGGIAVLVRSLRPR